MCPDADRTVPPAVSTERGPVFVPHLEEQELSWTSLDQRAVDTVRVLAADAVEKVGNGHPGTAMSLAPAAYLLFQKLMRHDPREPGLAGPGPVRPVPRPHLPDPVHPALPLRLRPGTEGPAGAADLGFADPGPPGIQAHQGRGDHHRPAGPGPGLLGRVRVLPAPHARPVRRRRPRRHEPRSTTPSGSSPPTATCRKA